MRTRYINGKASINIYSREEHGILFKDIDKDAVSIVTRLRMNGFESYIVGGAIRDLMLGRKPKDFDVVTQATPKSIHKLFRNSRIIGRRFKIVHVCFGNKIIEVSTFRSLKDHSQGNDNIFGSIEEDAQRRDFSINSLYYDPEEETILDFNSSMADFRNKKIRSLIPLNSTFTEDPVRLIRAVKFSVTTGFSMTFGLKIAIKKYASQLSRVGSSRLTEELNKILSSGMSSNIIYQLNKYHLLVYILPCLSVYGSFPEIYKSLEKLDNKIQKSKKSVNKSLMYLALTEPLLNNNEDLKTFKEFQKDIIRQIKVFLTPNSPANICIEEAAKIYTAKYFNTLQNK